MKRLLTAPLAILFGGFLVATVPHPAWGQVEPAAQLRLSSQSAWTGVGGPLRMAFAATNTSAETLEDLAVELIVEAPATSRSLYELSLTQDFAPLIAAPFPQTGSLGPGQTRTFQLKRSVDELGTRGDSGLYPLRIELRSRDITVGTLRTPMVFLIEAPKVPLNLAWTWVLSEPVQYRPDGTFLPGTLESDIAPGGRLRSMVDALLTLGRRRVDVAVSSVLVDQLQRMAQGYRISDPAGRIEVVPKGRAGAADAASLLQDLSTVAGREGVELVATPLEDPSLPALFRGGLSGELPGLAQEGRSLVEEALGTEPTSLVARPFKSQLDPATLPLLTGLGVKTVMLDPGFISAEKYQTPTVFRLVAGRASAAAVLPNPELATLMAQNQADPVLAAQVALGELAAIWLELPGTPGRGVAVLFGEDPVLSADFFVTFARLVRTSGWLSPITGTELVSAVASTGRGPVPPRTYESFSDAYMQKLLDSRASLTRFGRTASGSALLEKRLRADLLTAQSSTMLADPQLGLSFIDSVTALIRRTYDRVRIATSVVTLPSQRGLLPLSLTNDSGQELRVVVRFVTDRRLDFVQGNAESLTLPPGRSTLTVRVRAQTTGRIPVKVQVLSWGAVPDLIAERTMVIRSTAYNLVALFLTIGAALFLLAWWGRRFLPRRSS